MDEETYKKMKASGAKHERLKALKKSSDGGQVCPNCKRDSVVDNEGGDTQLYCMACGWEGDYRLLPTKALKQKASTDQQYKAGYAAQQAGKPESANPYKYAERGSSDINKQTAWQAGWADSYNGEPPQVK